MKCFLVHQQIGHRNLIVGVSGSHGAYIYIALEDSVHWVIHLRSHELFRIHDSFRVKSG